MHQGIGFHRGSVLSLFLFCCSQHAQRAMRRLHNIRNGWARGLRRRCLRWAAFTVHPFAAVTLREIVHVSNGGEQVRVRFTNEFGLDGLTISDAHVALSAGGSAIKDGTDHALTFGGAGSVRIPPGAAMYSDPVALAVPPLSDVAVSFYLPSQVMRGGDLPRVCRPG